MRDAASSVLVLVGLALFVVAVIALRRHRARGVGLSFLTTKRAALVALGVSFGVCTAGGAVAPPQQNAAEVRTTPSTTPTHLPKLALPRAPKRTTTTTTTTTLPTTTTAPVVAQQLAAAPATTPPRATATTHPYVAPSPQPTSPPPQVTSPPATGAPCHPSYTPCIPDEGTDVDCAGGSGDGPRYVQGPVYVHGPDEYRLDSDGDGVGCQS